MNKRTCLAGIGPGGAGGGGLAEEGKRIQRQVGGR